MKRTLLFSIFTLLILGGLFAQTPEGIGHQAVIRDAEGKLIINTIVGIKVSILQGNVAGTVVYSETHTPDSNANGLVTYVIGKGNVESGFFPAIDWASGPYYLKTEVDPSGGRNYIIQGVTEFLSVPYALHAKSTDQPGPQGEKGVGIAYIHDNQDGTFTLHLTDGGSFTTPNLTGPKGDKGDPGEGSQTLGNVLYNGNDGQAMQIKNIADPTDGQDVATKAYVDLLVARLAALDGVVSSFTDTRDNQVYKSVNIGIQVWMAENLRYLPSVAGQGTGSETDPYYYIYGYNGTNVDEAKTMTNYQDYGVLYNWPAAMGGATSGSSNPGKVQGACPPGWHVPTHDEWTQLERYVCNKLGNSDCATSFPYGNSATDFRGTNEGNALKSCRQVDSPLGGECNTLGQPRWNSDATHYGTDVVGFSALPGGEGGSGGYYGINGYGFWWSATEGPSSETAWLRSLYNDQGRIARSYTSKSYGFSLRCVRD